MPSYLLTPKLLEESRSDGGPAVYTRSCPLSVLPDEAQWILYSPGRAGGSSWCSREAELVRGSRKEKCRVGGFEGGGDAGSWGLSSQAFAQGTLMSP